MSENFLVRNLESIISELEERLEMQAKTIKKYQEKEKIPEGEELLVEKVTTSTEQHNKFTEWLNEQDLKAVEIQKQEIENPDQFIIECWERGIPYCGPIDGGLTYRVTRTTLGYQIFAIHEITKEEIDITEYKWW